MDDEVRRPCGKSHDRYHGVNAQRSRKGTAVRDEQPLDAMGFNGLPLLQE